MGHITHKNGSQIQGKDHRQQGRRRRQGRRDQQDPKVGRMLQQAQDRQQAPCQAACEGREAEGRPWRWEGRQGRKGRKGRTWTWTWAWQQEGRPCSWPWPWPWKGTRKGPWTWWPWRPPVCRRGWRGC